MTFKEHSFSSKYICILLLTLVVGTVQAENNVDTQGKEAINSTGASQMTIQHLLSRIKVLEEHVLLDKSLNTNEGDTYMPGWVMFPPEKQKPLWYRTDNFNNKIKPQSKGMLTPSGYESDKDIYSLATCGSKNHFVECLIKFPILDQFKRKEARGYVLNISTQPSRRNNARQTSVACLNKVSGSDTHHYRSNGFMNYAAPYTWQSDLVFCPVVSKDGKSALYIRLANNKGTNVKLDGRVNIINTVGTVLGYW